MNNKLKSKNLKLQLAPPLVPAPPADPLPWPARSRLPPVGRPQSGQTTAWSRDTARGWTPAGRSVAPAKHHKHTGQIYDTTRTKVRIANVRMTNVRKQKYVGQKYV